MAYITLSTDNGDFLEFHTPTRMDAEIAADLLNRSVEGFSEQLSVSMFED